MTVSRFPPPVLPVLAGWPGCKVERRLPPGVRRLDRSLQMDRCFVRDGRSAILLALKMAGVKAGDRVMVPGLHCPTMIAPVRDLGAIPDFFDVDDRGVPRLDRLFHGDGPRPKALLVAHYFGVPQPSALFERWWAMESRPTLIEDCAHLLVAHEDDAHVGRRAEFVCFSLRKFLPIPEGGLLLWNKSVTQEHRRWLRPAGPVEELKTVYRMIETARTYRLGRGRSLEKPSSHDIRPPPPNGRPTGQPGSTVEAVRRMTKTGRLLGWGLGIGTFRRRENWLMYQQAFEKDGLSIKPFSNSCPTAPYVFPLRLHKAVAGRVYRELRRRGVPVFRWDALWPETPRHRVPGAVALAHEVLQFPCHQGLTAKHVEWIVDQVEDSFHACVHREAKAMEGADGG